MKEKVERIKNEVGKHFCCQSSGSSRGGSCTCRISMAARCGSVEQSYKKKVRTRKRQRV